MLKTNYEHKYLELKGYINSKGITPSTNRIQARELNQSLRVLVEFPWETKEIRPQVQSLSLDGI